MKYVLSGKDLEYYDGGNIIWFLWVKDDDIIRILVIWNLELKYVELC